MSKLRNTTKNAILAKLDNTYFTAANFKVDYHEGQSTFLEITFLPQPEFKYKVSTSRGSMPQKTWQISQAPGIHLREAELDGENDFTRIISRIPDWAQRILDDYKQAERASPNMFADFEATINQKVEETNNDPNAYFDVDEINKIDTKLDELNLHFQNLAQENQELKSKLTSIQEEIDNIKNDLQIFPKNAWYRVSGAKVIKLFKSVATSPEGKTLLVDAARKYLL